MADDPVSRSITFTGRIRSFSHAFHGIAIMLRSQQNAWIHATAEALNTALEFLTDVASPEFHPIAGQAKDVAAGAVLIAAIGALLIGALVFGPRVVASLGWLGVPSAGREWEAPMADAMSHGRADPCPLPCTITLQEVHHASPSRHRRPRPLLSGPASAARASHRKRA